MQYYMINLLEHNCSIFAIILVLKVIITKIIRKMVLQIILINYLIPILDDGISRDQERA